jgi:capsular exopolysaccharide synthesis family protein
MSRIHEALKKAEQERSAQQAVQMGPGVSLEGAPALAGTTTLVRENPDVPELVTAQRSGPPTVAAILAACQHGQWNPDPSALVFGDGENHSAGKEVFRTLRTRLYQVRANQPLRVLLISSALPGEGKTFVTSNLSQSIVRQRERRVLLIDGDLRLSRLHQMLGAPPSPGLSDYLLGEADESAVLHRGADENLFFIPGGRSVSNPTELLANGRLEALLARLAPAFDWVLFDSPPVIPVSDATIIAKLCDGVLIVVRSGSTPFDLAQKACQEFQDKPLIGAVLNQADYREGYGGYEYYGGYGTELSKDHKES